MKKKLFSILFIMIGMLGIMNVQAASTTIGDTSTATSLPITRIVDNVTDKVTNTFTYAIAADSSNPAAVTGLPSSTTVVFTNVTPTSNKATVNKNLDLSAVTFTEVGDYKFTIQETASTDSTTYPIDDEVYTFYVAVRYEVVSGVPTDNLVATLLTTGTREGSTTKENIVFEAGSFSNLTLNKNVTGDMADRTKDFTFTITLSDTGINGTYGAATFVDGVANFILKHGDSFNVTNLPCGVTYTIVESGADDYNTYVNNSTTNSKTYSAVLSNDVSKNTVNYVNTKESSSLTGVIVNIIPFVALLGVSAVGIVLVRKKVRI